MSLVRARTFRYAAPVTFLIAASALAACGGSASSDERATAGPARSFMMGISTLPRELNAQAYAETFDLAAADGEIVLIQRTPPWADFLPGADVSENTAKTTASEKDAVAKKHLHLFFAIDPTDGSTGRDRLAGLPASLAGRDFSDGDVRAAFVSYAKYVALNYRPAYLALGVEMNLYYGKNKQDFDENFRSLYAEAYDRVKEISPETQVTVTFQYEDLQGILPTEDKHFARWELIKSFEAKMDVTAISTYPSFAYPAAAIPENYYSQLRAFTDRPIVIAEMGYASAAGVQGLNNGSEADQSAFLKRALAEAERLDMPFVIWFAGWDPAYAKDTPFGVFEHIGLLRADRSEKPAWSIWTEATRRPYRPG